MEGTIRIGYDRVAMGASAEQPEQPTFRERLGDVVCSLRTQIYYLFVVELLLLLLMLFSLAFLDPGTATYAILQIDFILFGITMIPIVAVLYGCRRRERW